MIGVVGCGCIGIGIFCWFGLVLKFGCDMIVFFNGVVG